MKTILCPYCNNNIIITFESEQKKKSLLKYGCIQATCSLCGRYLEVSEEDIKQ